jgi:hypothetical protein
MKKLKLQPVMNGKLRTAAPKEKVNGWKHTTAFGVHFYRRGKIAYILTPDAPDGAELEKFDYSKACYMDIHSYEDFTKFCDIKVVKEL